MSVMGVYMKIPKNRNKVNGLSITCHLNWSFINLPYDIFSHICYGLMIFSAPNFRPYFSGLLLSAIKSKPPRMYENTQKHNNIKGYFLPSSHIWHVDISFCESLVMICTTKRNCCSFSDVFLRYRALFPSRNKKKQCWKS